jgi:hypothetical protein
VVALSAPEDGRVPETEKGQEWYTNRDLFVMMQALGKEIGGLRTELRETTTKIRDYNGLRDDVKQYRDEQLALKSEIDGKDKGTKGSWGNVYNLAIFLVMLAAVLVAIFKR